MCGRGSASDDDGDFIAKLSVSSLYLSKNQAYRGHCLLILDIRHATRPDHLSADEWSAFCADLYFAEKVLTQSLQPDHINLEIMGNVVPHLHWQIVPRYRTDPRWGAPVWTTTIDEMPVIVLPEAIQTKLVQELRDAANREIPSPN